MSSSDYYFQEPDNSNREILRTSLLLREWSFEEVSKFPQTFFFFRTCNLDILTFHAIYVWSVVYKKNCYMNVKETLNKKNQLEFRAAGKSHPLTGSF